MELLFHSREPTHLYSEAAWHFIQYLVLIKVFLSLPAGFIGVSNTLPQLLHSEKLFIAAQIYSTHLESCTAGKKLQLPLAAGCAIDAFLEELHDVSE